MGNKNHVIKHQQIVEKIPERPHKKQKIILHEHSTHLENHPVLAVMQKSNIYGETLIGQQIPMGIIEGVKQWHIGVLSISLEDKEAAHFSEGVRNINFPNLRKLILQGNFIESVESLARLQAPFLENINISQNLLTTLVSLKKINSTRLQFLTLDNNFIQEIQFITFTSSPGITGLYIEFQPNSRLQISDISPIIKLPSNDTLLRIGSSKRISQSHVFASLQKKYSPEKPTIILKDGSYF